MAIEPWMVWLLIILIMVVAEIMTVGFFALIIAIGGVFGLITSLITDIIWIQALIFVIASVVMFFVIKPLISKLFPPKVRVKTASERLNGVIGVVIVRIDNMHNQGQIRALGEVWSARSADPNAVFEVGDTVKVKNISGVHAIVINNTNN